MKNSTNWTNWETGFFVMIVVTNLQRGQAIDAEHARNVAIYRLVVTLIGIIGLVTVQVLKRKNPPPAPLAATPESTEAGIAISYVNTRATLWRGELAALKHAHFMRKLLITFVVTVTFPLTAALWQKQGSVIALSVLPLTILFSAAAVGGFILAMTWLAILARCPTPTSTRPVTTEIRAEGIVDRLPEKTNMFPWSAIRRVFVQDGDLMIELVNAGCWIPREAFNDGDAEKCRAMIEALWKSNGTRWPEFAPLKSR